jgi:hypothetical protein
MPTRVVFSRDFGRSQKWHLSIKTCSSSSKQMWQFVMEAKVAIINLNMQQQQQQMWPFCDEAKVANIILKTCRAAQIWRLSKGRFS